VASRSDAAFHEVRVKGLKRGTTLTQIGATLNFLKTKQDRQHKSADGQALRSNFRRVERREWWLWGTAFSITLLVTLGLASFLLPGRHPAQEPSSFNYLPEIIRGLVGLVFLFDIYTVYQQIQIHRIRRQLVEREELFHLISENAADMIAVVDVEGRRLYNSLSYQKVSGYSSDELQSSFSLEQVHPDDRDRIKEGASQARATGVGQTLEYRFRHKDGSWLILESTSNVIRNAKGEPDKFVIVNRDITERKKAEQALRRSEADFRSLIEHAPYGIYRASTTGQLLQVNPALIRMLGYSSAEELLLQDLRSKVFRHSGEYKRLVDLLTRTDEIKDVEVEWLRKDGEPLTVRCSGRRINDEHGVAAYIEVFAEDFTEKRALERQLRMAQKMEAIGRLSGGIAHDFNNLLSVIIGYSRVLKKALGTDATLSEHAVEIEKAGQRAASLTKQLLAFSRQQVLTPVVLDLNALVSDMQKMLPRLLGEDIEISLELDSELGRLQADQSQIEQVIMNLAVNARDAMPDGGKLEIGTRNVRLDQTYTRTHPGSKPGDYVALLVRDTGSGMDAETLAHIFEPFFTTKERGKGTGLGLATVYGIVKQSNGYIWVDSEPGHGSTFQIFMPRYEGASEQTAQRLGRAEELHGSEQILLVEDAEPLRRLAKAFLEGAGFKVTSAENGEQALSIAAAHSRNFDLLLTDVVMPGMNGRVLAEGLTRRQPGLRVLYMSGYTDSFIAGHSVLEAGTELIQKPFTEETLIRKVREVLNEGRGRAVATETAGSLVESNV
jgi:two-component system cell cycle sensor histidine kinase/response regulator CckA